ncbi:MAG: alpha/beta hydrolase [Myxococcales bacterium]|nr:alpha/beta hydrolase [Myxococcales bacterium]
MPRAVTFLALLFRIGLGLLAAAIAAGCAHRPPAGPPPQLKMQLDVKGRGEPVVLVGGELVGWLDWTTHQEAIAKGRAALRAQPLAVQYGIEDRPLPDGYSVKLEADALIAGLDEMGISHPVDLVGWSYGALIALELALEHPVRVRTLALIEPPAFWVLAATGRSNPELDQESKALRELARLLTVRPSDQRLIAYLHAMAIVPKSRSPREFPRWADWLQHRRSLRIGEAAWAARGEVARLRALDRPVLLVKGGGSARLHHEVVHGLASELPRAILVELPSGHAPHEVSPEAFLQNLEMFHAAAHASESPGL